MILKAGLDREKGPDELPEALLLFEQTLS